MDIVQYSYGNQAISVCLKSGVDKQLQISPKSNGSFWPKMGCVVALSGFCEISQTVLLTKVYGGHSRINDNGSISRKV